jgi:hypothetical protein
VQKPRRCASSPLLHTHVTCPRLKKSSSLQLLPLPSLRRKAKKSAGKKQRSPSPPHQDTHFKKRRFFGQSFRTKKKSVSEPVLLLHRRFSRDESSLSATSDDSGISSSYVHQSPSLSPPPVSHAAPVQAAANKLVSLTHTRVRSRSVSATRSADIHACLGFQRKRSLSQDDHSAAPAPPCTSTPQRAPENTPDGAREDTPEDAPDDAPEETVSRAMEGSEEWSAGDEADCSSLDSTAACSQSSMASSSSSCHIDLDIKTQLYETLDSWYKFIDGLDKEEQGAVEQEAIDQEAVKHEPVKHEAVKQEAV